VSMSEEGPVVAPPARMPWLLAPFLWLTRRITGKDPLPARLLAHFPKGAVGAGMLEAMAAHGPGDLETRLLAIARIVASATAGCPFCIDMNAATYERAKLGPAELEALLALDHERWRAWPSRERIAAEYAVALSSTPVVLSPALRAELVAAFSAREVVVLATTIAQVNYWARFNHGLGVPSAGFFDATVCRLPSREG
jgi:AhpD family alkylhydroperoxidase